ncbi:hypothetical protein G7Y79_00027g060320 [Physcia stellaris]|nr:hypothetical protein G7Y79_00027g060320 [Physcia stellaris]
MLIEIITVGTVGMETFTNSISTTQTTTSTEDKTIVPTPAGFTPVLQENGYVPKIKGRDLVPRAVTPGPHVVRYSIAKNAKTQSITPTQYPNAVVCTQPSSAMYNHFTDDYWQNTLHYTAQEVSPDVTSTQTITSTSTYDQSGTTSTTTVDTTITLIETAIAPGPTYYAACSPDNLATNANGGYTISGVGISGSNYFTDAGTAYDCCAACQASNCKAAFFYANAYPSPWCFNSYQDTCTPGQTTDLFYTFSTQDWGYTISNGPCGQITNGGNYPDSSD